MEHLIVFAYVLILLIGLWASFSLRQQANSSGLPLLRHLFRYSVCMNSLVFLWLVGLYGSINLLGDLKAGALPALAIPLILLSFAAEIGLIYSLLHVVYHLRDRKPSPWAGRGLVAGILLFGISFIIALTFLIKMGNARWLILTLTATLLTGTFCASILLLSLFRTAGQSLDSAQTGIARSFALFVLPSYLILVAVFILPNELKLLLSVLNPIWLNLAPFLWLRYRWLQTQIDAVAPDLEDVLSGYEQSGRITKREREIMGLILAGKSNKEIEQQPCISINTVKNHIYNLYKKLDINSRGQLVSLVLSEQQSRRA